MVDAVHVSATLACDKYAALGYSGCWWVVAASWHYVSRDTPRFSVMLNNACGNVPPPLLLAPTTIQSQLSFVQVGDEPPSLLSRSRAIATGHKLSVVFLSPRLHFALI
jgi:hypothetical protein